MSFVIKTAKTVRNHWKKSTFAAILASYGSYKFIHYIRTQQIMANYCEKAAEYGKQSIPLQKSPRNITVILNPNANKRKAAEDFEKYCAPLLHLAGICVDVVNTESEGHAKTLVNEINGTEAVIVAGGDGTLSEVVTGLLRRTGETTQSLTPIGILPLGKSNSIGNSLFPTTENMERVQILVDATMAVIEEVTKPVDVMRIESLNEEVEAKPVYAMGSLKWGAYRDAHVNKDSYWYLGSLKKYATYIFGGLKSSLTWNCNGILQFTSPCDGCSNCYQVKQSNTSSKWFQKFVTKDKEEMRKLQTLNPDCGQKYEEQIDTIDLNLMTSNLLPTKSNEMPKLLITTGPKTINYLDFVKEGFKTENGEKRLVEKVIEGRTVEIQPKESSDDTEKWFSIDNENFEVKPIRVTLLPRMLYMYCKKENVNSI